jgi:hypothetical protein
MSYIYIYIYEAPCKARNFNVFYIYIYIVGRVAQSVQQLTMGWTVRGSRFFTHVWTGPGAHPASCTMDTGYFLGVKRPGHGADHPPPPIAEVENE